MRDDEVRPFYDFLTEEQHVYVYRTWSLLPGYHPDATKSCFDPLAEAQELDRRRTIPHLDHTVQVIRLLRLHLDRRRLVHSRDPSHPQQRSPSKRSDRRLQVSQAVPEVATHAQESTVHRPKVVSTETPETL